MALIFIMIAVVIIIVGMLIITFGYKFGLYFMISGGILAFITVLIAESNKKKKNPHLIKFRDLIEKDKKHFKPCPNCGEKRIMQRCYGWDGFVTADPECQNCKFRFVEEKSRLLRRRMFIMMSPEEYDQMTTDNLNQHATTQTT